MIEMALYGVLAILSGLAVAVAVVRRRLFVVTVRGSSMEPTYRPGDRVLARRAGLTEVQVGDVVIIGVREPAEPERQGSEWPGPDFGDSTLRVPGAEWIIKRATALPGDPVPREAFAALAQVPETAVPEGKLVVLGDGPHSADSQIHGYYDGDRLAGVVLRKLSRRRQDASGVGGTGARTRSGIDIGLRFLSWSGPGGVPGGLQRC